MTGRAAPSLAAMPFLWPLQLAALGAETTSLVLQSAINPWIGGADDAQDASALPWTTPNAVALELPSMRVRDFSTHTDGHAALICAPYASHGATIADFAQGHSIVAALSKARRSRIYLTDWRSATPAMRYFSIDTYLADLNVAVDDIGPPVDLIGLCQGGWMALVYAARFPHKVRRLVVAAAPVDVAAGNSTLSRTVKGTPLAAFEALTHNGGERVLGQHLLNLWNLSLASHDADRALQVVPDSNSVHWRALKKRFERWYAATVDLPGVYYLEVVRRLFMENQIAEGRFVALGRTVDLAAVRMPLFLLAAEDDEVVSPAQLFAVSHLV
ncbi:MAG: alpha/beta fold hydrolase, partial [Hyphomicrobium sp.]|nr:alpha/beta fold hydrolase [Hyphomicrobium sp.]